MICHLQGDIDNADEIVPVEAALYPQVYPHLGKLKILLLVFLQYSDHVFLEQSVKSCLGVDAT